MLVHFRKHLPFFLLLLGISLYSIYFSLFTILRYQKLYAHYFDLGIMHQTVYNSYKGISTGDFSRILEMTDPHASTEQVKRMSVHNDVLLAIVAPLYFIHEGPETLLVIQAVVVALGAYFIYQIAAHVFRSSAYYRWIALMFGYSYLLYPPLQKAVNFDFHAVTLAPTFILGMYYAWINKKYGWSLLFIILTLLTKEQIGLVVALFGLFIMIHTITGFNFSFMKKQNIVQYLRNRWRQAERSELTFAVLITSISITWVLFSMLWVIPYFRGSEHFGAEYYTYLKESPLRFFSVVFRYETLHYVYILLAPLGLLSLFSPGHLIISASEFATNILSANGNMRNIYFHYDTGLTAFVFIASVYGAHHILKSKFMNNSYIRSLGKKLKLSSEIIIMVYISGSAILFSLYLSPLPWGHHRDVYAWFVQPEKLEDVRLWKEYLKDDQIRVSTTGKLAPHFTSRRYFYDFAGGYEQAEYIVVDTDDISYGFQSEESSANYAALQYDWRYIKIYDNNNIKVYKNMSDLIINNK